MSNPNGMAGANLALGGLGTFMSAVGQFSNESVAKKAAKQNAAYAEYQAQDAGRRGQLELQKVQRQAAQVKGAQRASMAAKGLDLTDGSPLEVLTDTDYFAALDENTVKDNTAREVYGFRMLGRNYMAEAASHNPWLTAGATGLAGASSVASKWYEYTKAGTKPFKK